MKGLVRFASTCVAFVVLAACLLVVSTQAEANPSMRDITLVTAGLIGWAATHPGLTANDSGANSFSIGVFDRVDRVGQTSNAEYRHRWGRYLLWRFKPIAGAGVTGRRSLYGFGGLVLELHITRHLILAPSEALTLYFHGGGKRLGSPLDFRSGIDARWILKDGVSIGLGYHHISHWFLFGSFNPGTEILNVTVSIPVSE